MSCLEGQNHRGGALSGEVRHQCLREIRSRGFLQPVIRKPAQESGVETRNRANNSTLHGQWAKVWLGVVRAALNGV